MNKEELQELIDTMPVFKTIRAIEAEMGIPFNTLQQALKGSRSFPRRWWNPFKSYIEKECSQIAAPVVKSKSVAPYDNPKGEQMFEPNSNPWPPTCLGDKNFECPPKKIRYSHRNLPQQEILAEIAKIEAEQSDLKGLDLTIWKQDKKERIENLKKQLSHA
jgi:hypothetical protein